MGYYRKQWKEIILGGVVLSEEIVVEEKNEEEMKHIKIILGISKVNEEIIRMFEQAFIKCGCVVEICFQKNQIMSVEQCVAEHSDVSVLFVSEYLQSLKPYTVEDFERLVELNDKIVIVPIITDERKSTSFMSELLSLGICTAVFQADAKVDYLVDLAVHSRTRKEARHYYGTETINQMSNEADVENCVDYIITGEEEEQVKERLDYIYSKISEREFFQVVKKLPENIRSKMALIDEYQPYIFHTTGEKKKTFAHRLLKNTKQIQTEEVIETEEYIPAIMKQEFQNAIKKELIGFTGTQQRVGTTHQTILFANYLCSSGYTVAVVENAQSSHKCFQQIFDNYHAKDYVEYFTCHGVDYYANFNLSNINQILLKSYNFVLVDFGVFQESIMKEFGRCVMQVVVTGGKPWEIPYLENLMRFIEKEEVLKEFYYLFTFTPEIERKDIINNMDVLNKVYFSEYQPDIFSMDGYDAIKKMLEHYLPTIKTKGGKRVFKYIKDLFQ